MPQKDKNFLEKKDKKELLSGEDSMSKLKVASIFLVIAVILTLAVYGLMNKNEIDLGDNKELKGDNLDGGEKDLVKEALEMDIKKVKEINVSDHILGNIDAPVQFIVYSDFQCPFCADFNKTLKKVTEEFGDNVAIAFRHFPLSSIHPNAIPAAIASECAAEQGKFWEMHDKLFLINATNNFNIEWFKSDAEGLVDDIGQFSKCLDDEKYLDKIEGQIEIARKAGVTGTPKSFINGQELPGAYPFEDFTDSGGYERMGMKSIIMKHLEAVNN